MSKITEGYIRYSNEKERKAAIKQAKNLGFEEWVYNRAEKSSYDNCILLGGVDDKWNDDVDSEVIADGLKEIPLDTKFINTPPTIDQDILHSLMEHQFMFQKKKYTKTESEDGTITLTPKQIFGLGLITYFDKKKQEFFTTSLMPISVVKDYENKFKKNDQIIILEVIEREYEI